MIPNQIQTGQWTFVQANLETVYPEGTPAFFIRESETLDLTKRIEAIEKLLGL